jgi:aminopeptidase N
MALSPYLPPQASTMIVPSVARAEHIDQAWDFAVAHKDDLMKVQDAIGRTRAFPAIVSSSANAADADKLEAYVKANFGPDALVEAQRASSGIRVRAAQKAKLIPQLRAALSANVQ